MKLKYPKRLIGLTLASVLASSAVPAFAGRGVVIEPEAARVFAQLPEGVRYPEGIAADPSSGDLFVATFDFGPNANQLMRLGRRGRLEAQLDFGGAPLLGLAFNPGDGKVYIANFGASQIQRVAADFDSQSVPEVVATLPAIGAPGVRTVGNPDGSEDQVTFGSSNFPAPNAMVFSTAGHLYVSDSFQGAIYRIDDAGTCAPACTVSTVAHDPLLATPGFPPFGANGLALSADEAVLFVANTGDDRVLKIDLADGSVSVFAEGINGADGLAMGPDGTLWVAANQADQIVGLDAQGQVVAKLGEYHGVRADGALRRNTLLFPASLVIVRDTLYVTNLSLPLTASSGDEPEESVTRHAISSIRLKGGHRHPH